MGRQAQVQLPSGEVIWANVSVDGPTNVSAISGLHKLDADEFRAVVHGVSDSLRLALSGLRPDEVSVEFGVELALKTGKLTSVLAEASGKASVRVMLAWRDGRSIPEATLSAGSEGDAFDGSPSA
jgi:hypothetical protein